MNWKQTLDAIALHIGYTVLALILLMNLFTSFVRIFRFFLGDGSI